MSVKKLCQQGSTDGPDNVLCEFWRPDKSSAFQPVSPASEDCCTELQEVLCLRNTGSLPSSVDGSCVQAVVTHPLLTLVRYLASLQFPTLARDGAGGRKPSASWAEASYLQNRISPTPKISSALCHRRKINPTSSRVLPSTSFSSAKGHL